jgi:hypothetical protein
MPEAVRFYWLRGQASVPLDAIPEGERQPLRVRRSVAQAHAPEILKELESGRFVAAAWESAGSISLILCHPNLAKGPVDTLLVDTTGLPSVVLNFSEWDDVHDSVRLLLRAFGGEAASLDDCERARRELVTWLTEHDQPRMAKVVNRLQAFPFGVRSDAIEVINGWRHVLVSGEKEQIDRFLEQVGQRFEGLGWTPDRTYEANLNGQDRLNRFYCWISGPKSQPYVLLCLNRATDRRVRGGTFDYDDRATISDLACAIQRVLAEVIEPAAAAVGLSVSYPRLGPISRVGAETDELMSKLADESEGQWPLPEQVEGHWREFVRTAYRDDVAISPDELTRCSIDSGWPKPAAAELTKRFYNDIALIQEYEEVGRQPA